MQKNITMDKKAFVSRKDLDGESPIGGWGTADRWSHGSNKVFLTAKLVCCKRISIFINYKR